jgi:Cytochrome c554 and c-prime
VGHLTAQQKASYVGAIACGKCHPRQLMLQSASAHAHALSRAAQHPLAAFFVPKNELVRPPRYHFQFMHSGGQIRVRAFDGQDAIELPVEWAFGAGEQAVTFVSRVNAESYLEHYFSYYSATQSLGPTPGHEGLRSNTLPLAMGLAYRPADPVSGMIKCFECHSTGPPTVSVENEIQPAELGVRCESCHGPGSLHVAAAMLGQSEKARGLIRNPKRMSAAELNQFCGECHRAPEGGPAVNYYKAWSVRYQPIYLSQSACFLKSEGALSCLTCHDPHQKLDRDGSHYGRRCAGCHDWSKHPPQPGYTIGSTDGCIECHMPRVAAQANLEFTNHWIGIYSEENKLTPRH